MRTKSAFFYAAGIAFLFLAKAKNFLLGYTSPKPIDLSAVGQCIAYDFQVVDHWISHLKEYTGSDELIRGASVLELGPGSDLGVGIRLLSLGCNQYNACDVNDLATSVPKSFYDELFSALKTIEPGFDSRRLQNEISTGDESLRHRLNYVVRDDFDISKAFERASIDLVFSQAAFEHFDDIEDTMKKLSIVTKDDAVLIAEIDLTTHSRWIRDVDPNNIYRYPKWLYSLFYFRGAPNRVRPLQYKSALERHGWTDVRILPLRTLPNLSMAEKQVHPDFRENKHQIELLTFMVYARKSRPAAAKA